MGDCTCGWLLSQEGACANPNHDGELLREAAEQAYEFLANPPGLDVRDSREEQVLRDLEAVLGKTEQALTYKQRQALRKQQIRDKHRACEWCRGDTTVCDGSECQK